MVQDFFRNSITRMPVLILSIGAVMNKNPAVVPFVLSRTTSCFEEYLNPIQKIPIITILDNKTYPYSQFWFHCMICFFDDQVVVGSLRVFEMLFVDEASPVGLDTHQWCYPPVHPPVFEDFHGQANPGSSRRWHWGEDQQPLSGGRFGRLRIHRVILTPQKIPLFIRLPLQNSLKRNHKRSLPVTHSQ